MPAMNQFGLVQAVERLGQGVVITVALAAHRGGQFRPRTVSGCSGCPCVATPCPSGNSVCHLARAVLCTAPAPAHPVAFTLSRSALVVPVLAPVSTSSCLTHSFSVCGTQPIFGAMNSMADHSEGNSPGCSCTMRTEGSRNSGKNLFDFFMAQSSQRYKLPENPRRRTGILDKHDQSTSLAKSARRDRSPRARVMCPPWGQPLKRSTANVIPEDPSVR